MLSSENTAIKDRSRPNFWANSWRLPHLEAVAHDGTAGLHLAADRLPVDRGVALRRRVDARQHRDERGLARA